MAIKLQRSFGILLRGMAMGAADIVPGVSGGTVAFITGIYPQLLASIKAVDLSVLKALLSGDISGAWRAVNGDFLLPLMIGILLSIFTLAQVVLWVLTTFPLLLWAFFFGLIVASALLLITQVKRWYWPQCLCFVLGLALAAYIATMPANPVSTTYWMVFLTGSLAICAMILPGISGSFILLLLGMYGSVLTAIKELDMLFMLIFASGCAVGLLAFSRLLHWLFEHYAAVAMALLTGFLVGSLIAVWPWKKVVSHYTDSQGEFQPLQQLAVSPQEYTAFTGFDSQWLLCLGLMLGGALLVLALNYFAKPSAEA